MSDYTFIKIALVAIGCIIIAAIVHLKWERHESKEMPEQVFINGVPYAVEVLEDKAAGRKYRLVRVDRGAILLPDLPEQPNQTQSTQREKQ